MKKDENRQKRTIKRTVRVLAVLTGACLVMLLGGCGKKEKEPVTVTLWHVYGGQTESPLNDLIDEFNETVGKDKNIRVEVGSVTNTNIIHEGVLAAANKEPGASELPDMFVSYPKTVTAMPDPDVLVNYKDYFTDEELSAFIPAFVEEGTIDGKLAILPVAKSTEILFIIRPPLTVLQRRPGQILRSLRPGMVCTSLQRCTRTGVGELSRFLSMTIILIISRLV